MLLLSELGTPLDMYQVIGGIRHLIGQSFLFQEAEGESRQQTGIGWNGTPASSERPG